MLTSCSRRHAQYCETISSNIDVRIKTGRGYAEQRMLRRMTDQADDQNYAFAHLPDQTDGANESSPNDFLHTGASGRDNTTEKLPLSNQNENPVEGQSNELARAVYFARIAAQMRETVSRIFITTSWS
jgi:hypothetical protein